MPNRFESRFQRESPFESRFVPEQPVRDWHELYRAPLRLLQFPEQIALQMAKSEAERPSPPWQQVLGVPWARGAWKAGKSVFGYEPQAERPGLLAAPFIREATDPMTYLGWSGIKSGVRSLFRREPYPLPPIPAYRPEAMKGAREAVEEVVRPLTPAFSRKIHGQLRAHMASDEIREAVRWLHANPDDPLTKIVIGRKGALPEATIEALRQKIGATAEKLKGRRPPVRGDVIRTTAEERAEALARSGTKLKEEHIFRGTEREPPISLVPSPGVPQAARPRSEMNILQRMFDDFLRVVAPGARGEQARFTALAIRENAARYNLQAFRLNHMLRQARSYLDKASPETRLAFLDAVEEGKPITDPALREAGQYLSKLHDGVKNELIAAGKDGIVDWIEHYFPHIWKNPHEAQRIMRDYARGFQARMKGLPAGLRKRIVPTTRFGIEKLGLEPLYLNPLDTAIARYHEMTKYITKIRTLNELKQAGIATVEKGQTIVPEAVQRVLNNYLSPGLHMYPSFRAFRNLGNLQVGIQLGLSGFHAGFTTFDVAASHASAALYELVRGNIGRAAQLAASVPISPIANVIRGHKLYLNALDPTKYPEVAPILESIVRGGGRARMDAFYRNDLMRQMMTRLRQGGFVNTMAGLLKVPGAAVEATVFPILEWLVPRQKLGVMSMMIENEIKRNPNMTIQQMRDISAKIVDSVDNRLGQLVYDNLFWNKTFKDIMMSMWRSVGWNLGTWREFGGGAVDTARMVKNLMTRKNPVEFTHRMAYTMTLPVMVGTMGAITQYLATGKPPSAESPTSFARDLYYPQINEEGDRISFPTYMKDLAHIMLKFPGSVPDVISAKIHPTISMLGDIWRNRDFFNVEIRHVGDSVEQQLTDIGKYIVSDIIQPISITTMRKLGKRGVSGVMQWLPQVGIMPAPTSISRTPAEELATKLVGRVAPPRSRTQAERLEYVKQLAYRQRQGQYVGAEAMDLFRRGEISRRELRSFYKKPPDMLLFDVSRLSLHDAINVYNIASPEEKKRLTPIIKKKQRSFKKQRPYAQVEMPEEEGGEEE